ncbi:hypothetical protein MC378_13775 [Polaribacter sp. MSW13]|uniref:Uncharacterized protein n=1 Tax=Polaribacter marinus TaxID=2916838 RepID=A0A9X1VSL2_9FLAO|nr:hypothetical protein [Polaribacter marinus]MCI2230242.1 hypothetical protein [Polaribacter marinus]
MKVAKYILSIFLIMGGFGFIAKGDFIAGLLTLILGGILLPPVSEKIKEQVILFQNKKIRYGIYIGLLLIAGAFMPKSDAEVFGSKKDVLINYIKNNKNDKSLQNIKNLAEIGSMFGNNNYALRHPQQGYISEQYDSIKKVAVLTFNPKFDYNGSDDISYLKDDAKNGKIKGYALQYEINEDDSITLKKTTITYAKIIKEFMTINDVPSFETFVDEVAVRYRKEEVIKEEKIANERRKFNEIMGNDEFWNKYDPIVKKRIYKLIIGKNCGELQEQFTIAADMSEIKHSTGKRANKELELMDFIDEKMRDLDCY